MNIEEVIAMILLFGAGFLMGFGLAHYLMLKELVKSFKGLKVFVKSEEEKNEDEDRDYIS